MIELTLVIITAAACVAVAHPQTFYPAAFSYQNSFIYHDRQPYVVSENKGMDRFTNVQFLQQSAPQRFLANENQITNSQDTKQSAPLQFTGYEHQDEDRFPNAQFTKQSQGKIGHEEQRVDQFRQPLPPQRIVEENQEMERFTNAHFNKQSNISQRENESQYAQSTGQRDDKDNDRASSERFQKQF